MKAIFGLLDIIPGWVWAAICAGAIATSCTHAVRLDREKAAHAQTRAVHAEQESERLRETLREVSRLTVAVKGAQDAYQQERGQVLALRNRLRDAGQRLRDQQADTDARIAAASADGVRRYAQAVSGDLARCRVDVERFGVEAAACSAAAHALKRNLDSLTKPP
ncbi:hypothetical protein [Hydrogenophaga sp. T2]|uniref:hypothetical protein n=1 Tax=Hydrogenophaga sp. T2 TaxID=3132823 RepID=UPI003CF9DB7D